LTNYFTFLKRSSVSSFEAKHLFIVFTFISHYTDLIVPIKSMTRFVFNLLNICMWKWV